MDHQLGGRRIIDCEFQLNRQIAVDLLIHPIQSFFRPSSTIKVALLRKSAVPLRNKHVVGQYTGTIIELLESGACDHLP